MGPMSPQMFPYHCCNKQTGGSIDLNVLVVLHPPLPHLTVQPVTELVGLIAQYDRDLVPGLHILRRRLGVAGRYLTVVASRWEYSPPLEL